MYGVLMIARIPTMVRCGVVLCFLAGAASAADVEGGLAAAERGDYAAAKLAFESAAEAGDGRGAFFVGVIYDTGAGVDRDLNTAAIWYRKAAELDVAEAQYNLAVMYANGEGLPKDLVHAYVWFRRAADNGMDDAAGHIETLENMMSQDALEKARDLFGAKSDAQPVAKPDS